MNLNELKVKIPDIFEDVRRDVDKFYKEFINSRGKRRAGISLGLVEMGMYQGGFIGGMHFPPGTDIVMNKTPLKILLEQQPDEIVVAYTYHILLHEYVHSLGIWDEMACRKRTLEISQMVFKDPKHPALRLAKGGIGTFFPNLKLIYAPPEMSHDGMMIEYIKGFDKQSYDYYS